MNKAKLEAEKAKIQEIGIEAYLKQRKVKIDLIWFLASVGIAFAAGVILF